MKDKNLFDLNILFDGETDYPEGDFFPILSQDEEMRIEKEDIPETLNILPLRNTVLFPGIIIPITIGREKSIQLIKDVYKTSKMIGVVAQKNSEVEDPNENELYSIGTVAYIIKLLQMPDGNNTIIIQGRSRFEIEEFTQKEPYFKAKVKPLFWSPPNINTEKYEALIDSIKDISIQIINRSPNLPTEAGFAIRNIESPNFLVHFVCSHLNIPVFEKQTLLEIKDPELLAKRVLEYLSKELQMSELKTQIQKKVKKDIDKQQRDYLLNMQLKTIQEELGSSPHEHEIKEFKEKAKTKKWSKELQESFDKEVLKLQRMHPAAAEYSIQLNYIDFLVELPWNEFTKDLNNLKKAAEVLDRDHFGLEKVKERIIEFLAVLKLKNNMSAPILCLVGPPGVGKTSLGKSIAESLGRKYIRISLGGLRDEAELRGHRKTYIGAMPGRIIQSLKKAKSANPVFVLDEIDKVSGLSISGDPQAALLEILDPEQNFAFHDNYLEVDFDLSKILFIATGNTLSTVHPALKDRMEVIEVSGYTLEEKVEIASKHLVPKQMKMHGLKNEQIIFDKNILAKIIEDYTRESGVRNLEQNITKIIRGCIKKIVENEPYNKLVNTKEVENILGIRKFQKEKLLQNKFPGVATGLAWTPYGGEILFVEVSLSKGKCNLTMTGSLGDVMKESATLAFEYIKSHASLFNIKQEELEEYNIHVHVPEGATPKDGPSAGITIFAAMLSAFANKIINSKIAMTGEITLRGKVIPVGGIKEKILAAKRAKITEIILSEDNKKDVQDIEKKYTQELKFHYVDEMKDVYNIVLC